MLRQIDEEENDPNISQADKDKLDEFRTTLIKQEILKMLGLESAPNVSNSPQVPKQMVDSVLRQTDRKRVNEASASREVIVMAEQDPSLELANSRKLFLQFHTNLQLSSVLLATLVVRRNPQVLTKKRLKKHRLLIVRIVDLAHQTSNLVGHPKVIETGRNWIKLDISPILKSHGSNKLIQNITVEVTCEECGSENAFLNPKKRRPFLIFNMKPVNKLRKRRSASCVNSNKPGCCLEQYTVSFRDMGYRFVLQPQKFYLNFCKGPCQSRSSSQLFLNRINIFTPRRKTNPNDNCCVVRTLMSLSILYRDKDGNINKVNVPNVTALDCECA